jgi:hypothetical protein
MKGIMADNNVERHFRVLLGILQSDDWRESWDELKLAVHTFETQGLSREVNDLLLWQTCQAQEVVLITINRNHEGPESLESAIRAFNSLRSLPVLTLANPDHVRKSRAYTERVVERLLDLLLHIDNYRGAGRISLP